MRLMSHLRNGPDHDDRAWRVMHDLVADRAEDELACPAEASRSDDHQRGVLRCVDEGRRGTSRNRLALDRMGEVVHVGVAHRVVDDLVGGLVEDGGALHRPGYAMSGTDHADTSRTLACRARASSSAHASARAAVSDPSTPTMIRSSVGNSFRPSAWMTATGHCACCSTCSLTEPMRRPRNPPEPRAPTTSRSASCEIVTSARHGRSQTDTRPMLFARSAPRASTTHLSSTERASSSEYAGSNSSSFGAPLVQVVPRDHRSDGEVSELAFARRPASGFRGAGGSVDAHVDGHENKVTRTGAERAGPCGWGDEDERPDRVHCTTSAVTMPVMPFAFSAWGRMWQCHTQVPTSVACTSTV